MKEKYKEVLDEMFKSANNDAAAFKYYFNSHDNETGFCVVLVGDKVAPANYVDCFGKTYKEHNVIVIPTHKVFKLPLFESVEILFEVAGNIEDNYQSVTEMSWASVANMMYQDLYDAEPILKKVDKKIKKRKKIKPYDEIIPILGIMTNLLINAENLKDDTGSFMAVAPMYDMTQRTVH